MNSRNLQYQLRESDDAPQNPAKTGPKEKDKKLKGGYSIIKNRSTKQ